MSNKPITPEEMKAYIDATWKKWQAEAWQEPRQWQGLTDEEVSKLIDNEIGFNSCWGPEEQFARAIEAKLKERNND